MKLILFFVTATLFVTLGLHAAAPAVGKPLPAVTLSGKHGGTAEGRAWHSSGLRGKVHLLLYMNPSKRKEAMPFLERLNAKRYPTLRYSTIAIVNLAATWMPDSLLEKMLASKQKGLYATRFLFDRDRTVASAWSLPKDANTLIVLDRRGRVRLLHSGSLGPKVQRRIFDTLDRLLRSSITK